MSVDGRMNSTREFTSVDVMIIVITNEVIIISRA